MSDDQESQPTPMLASDAERENSVTQLRDAVGEGRLTLDETFPNARPASDHRKP